MSEFRTGESSADTQYMNDESNRLHFLRDIEEKVKRESRERS